MEEKRSCNRHSDCDEADRRAKERWETEQKKPWRERNADIWPYTEHCHDDCCEDCLGS